MDQIRIGVIGSGEIAQIMHLPFLTELGSRFSVTAICDISPKLVDQIGNRYHIEQRYTDYRELLAKSNVDAVAILTFDHARIAIDAAQARKHIFVEKPLCFNLQEADQIILAAEQNKITLMVGYMKRFDPGYEFAQSLMRDMQGLRLIRVHDVSGAKRNGSLYPLNEMFTLYRYSSEVPKELVEQAQAKTLRSLQQAIGTDRSELVSAYLNLLLLSSHDASILRGAFGDPVAIRYSDVFQENGRYVVAVLEYPNDVRCVWEIGGLEEGERVWWDEELVAFGSAETIQVRFPNPYVPYAPTVVTTWRTTAENECSESRSTISYDEAFRREWFHFHQCITNGETPRTNAIDAKKDIRLLSDLVKASVRQPMSSITRD